ANRERMYFEPGVLLQQTSSRQPHRLEADDGVTADAPMVVVLKRICEATDGVVDISSAHRTGDRLCCLAGSVGGGQSAVNRPLPLLGVGECRFLVIELEEAN